MSACNISSENISCGHGGAYGLAVFSQEIHPCRVRFLVESP